MQKFFRHKTKGIIYPYNERLKNNPNVELVDERTAYPEAFAPKAVLEHKQKVDISVPKEVVEQPPYNPPELAAQATKSMELLNVAPMKRKVKTVPTTPNFTGLIED